MLNLCASETAERAVRRGRPSTAEAEQIVGRILDASWEVLHESGFEGFTFDRVARHARIGKATIYSRFAHKRELMLALLQHRIQRQKDMVDGQADSLPLHDQFAFHATEVLLLLLSADGILMERLIDWLDQEAGTGTAETRMALYRSAMDKFEAMLRLADEGGHAQVPDPALAARFWLEGVLGHTRLANSEGVKDRAPLERWARNFVRYFFAGLSMLDPEPPQGN